MTYKSIVEGTFIKRLNRFIAEVEIEGQIEQVHVKNTGRCAELFIEGTSVFLEPASNPDRKTKYSLISIYKGDRLINIDSQVPNQVVFEAVKEGLISEVGQVDYIKREVTYHKSRFDIFFRKGNQEGFIEVKGVTLEKGDLAMFPDAPTERGRKHILELIDAKKEGYEAYIFFLIQMNGIKGFKANDRMDKPFAQALDKAKEEGVNVLLYDSVVTKDSIVIASNINKYINR